MLDWLNSGSADLSSLIKWKHDQGGNHCESAPFSIEMQLQRVGSATVSSGMCANETGTVPGNLPSVSLPFIFCNTIYPLSILAPHLSFFYLGSSHPYLTHMAAASSSKWRKTKTNFPLSWGATWGPAVLFLNAWAFRNRNVGMFTPSMGYFQRIICIEIPRVFHVKGINGAVSKANLSLSVAQLAWSKSKRESIQFARFNLKTSNGKVMIDSVGLYLLQTYLGFAIPIFSVNLPKLCYWCRTVTEWPRKESQPRYVIILLFILWLFESFTRDIL